MDNQVIDDIQLYRSLMLAFGMKNADLPLEKLRAKLFFAKHLASEVGIVNTKSALFALSVYTVQIYP